MSATFCGCDELVAEHHILSYVAHNDCGTVTLTWQCQVCKYAWEEEPTYAEMMRREDSLEPDFDLFASEGVSVKCPPSDAHVLESQRSYGVGVSADDEEERAVA